MKTRSEIIISFIREIVIVIFGILIALSINNWNENRKNQTFIDKALFAIEEETQLNQTEIKDITQRHTKLLDTIANNLENDSISLRGLIERVSGFQIPELKNIGLRFFVSNKAELIDYKIISELSEIEFFSETLQTKTTNMLEFLYKNMESKNESDKYSLAVYLSDVIDSEKELLELYDSYLGKK